MSQHITHLKSIVPIVWGMIVLGSAGCVTPFNTRTPTVVHRPPEMERREAQIHDPYPDKVFGPDTGFRPLGFNEQRSEPQRAKDRFYTAMLRTQNGAPFAPQSMAPYPQQVYGQPVVPNAGYYPQQTYVPPQGQYQQQPQQQVVQPQPYSPQPMQ